MLDRKIRSKQIIWSVILILAAFVSMTVLSGILSSTETYAGIIEIIDDQKNDAIVLNATVTAISTTLTTLPDDMGSPVANEIANLTDALFASICVLYVMKFMLTTFGWMASIGVIPVACVVTVIHLLCRKEICWVIAKKLFCLAAVMIFVIPISVKITAMTEEVFTESITRTLDRANNLADNAGEQESEDTNAFIEFFAGLKDDVVSLVDKAKNMLGILTDAVAVLMITSCVIPLLTAVVMIWAVNSIVNTHIQVKDVVPFPRGKKMKYEEQERLVS